VNRRTQWRDGVKGSALTSKARHAARVLSDWWKTDQLVIWVEMAVLAEEMGVSKRTAQYAVRELEDAGWLVVVEKARQHRCPRYAPTIPRGADSALLDDSRGADPAPLTVDNPVDNPPRGADSALRGAESAPDTKDTKPTTTTSTNPVSVTAADDLAMVVVEALPQHLATGITRSVLRRKCIRLTGIGWTPDLLRPVLAARSWNGIHPGGVITWIDELERPVGEAPKAKTAECEKCIGGWLPDASGYPSARRCRTCRPNQNRATA